MGAINPVRNPDTPSTFFQPMDFYWSSSVISNGVKELGIRACKKNFYQ
jgi:hypothetical protein